MRGKVFILLMPLTVSCLKISSFEVPSLLVVGDSAYLTCLYDLGGEKLYSVKWFKNDHEFYRYFPSLNPQYMAFASPGIFVDLTKSGRSTVYLTNVTLETEGRFTCQVSADEPFFGCVQVHRDISVYVPPEESPEITGEFTDYGENLTIRCSSAKSKPAANLSWYINDVMTIPEGAISSHAITKHSDRLETSSAKLDIPSSTLPVDGPLRLACEATISNLVTSVSKELLIAREHSDQPQKHRAPSSTSSPPVMAVAAAPAAAAVVHSVAAAVVLAAAVFARVFGRLFL